MNPNLSFGININVYVAEFEEVNNTGNKRYCHICMRAADESFVLYVACIVYPI